MTFDCQRHRYSARYVGLVVFLLFLANTLNYGHRLLLSILLPAMRREIVLSDTQAGFLMGGAFALCYAILGVPLARIADRSVRRTFIAIALLSWSTLTALLGLVGSFAQIALIRVGIGLGEAVCIPCSQSLISDFVSAQRRATAFATHSAGSVLGATAALMAGGYFSATIGWRWTFFASAVPGIMLAVVIWRVIDEPLHGYSDGISSHLPQPPFAAVLEHLVSKPMYRFVLGAVCFGMLVEFGTSQWLPTFYVREFGLSLRDVGFRYGLAVAIGGLPGGLLGGIITDRLIRYDLRWMLWLPAACYVLAIPVGLTMLIAPNANLTLALNALYAFLIMATNGPFWSSVFLLVPANMRATTSAITLMVAGIVGLAMGPVLVGLLSDYLSHAHGEATALRSALRIVISSAVTVVAFMLTASAFLPKEYRLPPSKSLDIAPGGMEI